MGPIPDVRPSLTRGGCEVRDRRVRHWPLFAVVESRYMRGDRACGCYGGALSTIGDVPEGAPEVPEAVRLADEIGMKRDAHHQRRVDRLLEHLVEIVDDHVRKLLGRIFAGDDRRNVVDLLR